MGIEIKVLDHGYVRLVECWGAGDAGGHLDYECGIVEAARQSTQGSFRGWEPGPCPRCKGYGLANCGMVRTSGATDTDPCPECRGKGIHPGDKNLAKHLFNHRHATPFEFSGAILEVQGPIFVFREWHRHRTQSYNEMSARYAPLPNNNYMPTPERCLVVNATNKQAGAITGAPVLTHESAIAWLEKLDNLYAHCELVYQDGLDRGIPKEISRVGLPVGRYSRMRASANLRNWLGFVSLRSSPDAQEEIRQFSNAVGTILFLKFPRTWELFEKSRAV